MFPIRSETYPSVMTAVYRLYDAAGQLLYVGVAEDFDMRFRQHSYNKTWWSEVARKDVTWYPDRLSALTEEARAIEVESPVHNTRRGHSRIGLMVVQRPPSHLEGYDPLRFGIATGAWRYAHLACPTRPELEFNDSTCRNIIRETFGRGCTEVVIVRDGEPAAMAIPWHAFVRYSAALGEPIDISRMNQVAAEDLYRKERAPLTLSVRLTEVLDQMRV
jgi:predicted GIY-YIG superfamily endonuclease